MDGLKARVASRNANKARELEHLLPDWKIEPLEADDYPAEEGDTYYENARGKALFGRTRADLDEWVLSRAARKASASTRSSSRMVRRGPLPSWAIIGSAQTPTAQTRPARCLRP